MNENSRATIGLAVLLVIALGAWFLFIGPALGDLFPAFRIASPDPYSYRELPDSPREWALLVYCVVVVFAYYPLRRVAKRRLSGE